MGLAQSPACGRGHEPRHHFDLASLTKVVATTTAVLQLVEQGRVQLDAPATRYWPAFPARAKTASRFANCWRTSGLRAGCFSTNPIGKANRGHATCVSQPPCHHRERTLYSDINFGCWAKLLQQVSHALAITFRQHITATAHARFGLPAALSGPAIAPPNLWPMVSGSKAEFDPSLGAWRAWQTMPACLAAPMTWPVSLSRPCCSLAVC